MCVRVQVLVVLCGDSEKLSVKGRQPLFSYVTETRREDARRVYTKLAAPPHNIPQIPLQECFAAVTAGVCMHTLRQQKLHYKCCI